MFVLSLCQQLCADKLPVQPLVRLGDGADGEVLSIQDQPDRVIKLSIIYDTPSRKIKEYKNIKQVLELVMATQPPAYVRVYEHGYLGTFSRKMVDWHKQHQDFLMYYYIMEKLSKITEDEKKVFHSIISHEDRGIEKNYTTEKIEEMLWGMSRALDFDYRQVMLFCDNLRRANVFHKDVHVRNIMKNADGIFKIIDIDRATL